MVRCCYAVLMCFNCMIHHFVDIQRRRRIILSSYPDVRYAVSSPDGASVADDSVKLERDNTRVAACSAHSSQLDGLLGGVSEA